MDKSLNNQNRRQNSSNDNAIVANLQIGQNQCECWLVCPWHRRWPPSDVAVQALRCLSTAFHLLQGWKWILEPELWSVFSHNIQNNHARFSPRLLLQKRNNFPNKYIFTLASLSWCFLSRNVPMISLKYLASFMEDHSPHPPWESHRPHVRRCQVLAGFQKWCWHVALIIFKQSNKNCNII